MIEMLPGDTQPPKWSDFEIPPTGRKGDREKLLHELDVYLKSKHEHMVGYQFTQDMNHYRENLSRFMVYHTNNLGDPFTPDGGGYKPNSKPVEQSVLNYYATLWNAKTPHDPHKAESYWGYMLSMGSTEGNMYALWNARDYLSGEVLLPLESSTGEGIAATSAWSSVSADTMRKLKHSEDDGEEAEVKRPVAFFSEDAHYSFTKAVRILGVDTPHEAGIQYRQEFPPVMPSAESGQIDVDVLVERVRFFAEQGHPIFVNFNLGSTIKGAYDNVQEACDRLLPVFAENQLLHRVFEYVNPTDPQTPLVSRRRGFWINIDGALGAGYVPFMHLAKDAQLKDANISREDIPVFDFSVTSTHGSDVEPMVSSIVMSGHKWAGAPWPCGVYMTRTKYEMEPPSSPQYIGSLDSTFAGSRNGFSPLVLWDHLAQHSYEDQTKKVLSAMKLAEETKTKLVQLEKDLNLGGDGLYVHRSPLSLAVMFRKPADDVIAKWSLSQAKLSMTVNSKKEERDYVHLFLMPSADEHGMRKKIDALIGDLKNYGYNTA